MTEEDFEPSEELVELKEFTDEVKEHAKRIASLEKKGSLKANVAGEVSGTLMPLLSDLSEKMLKQFAIIEEWMASVEEELEDTEEETSVVFSEDDKNLFSFLFDRLAEFVSAAKASTEDVNVQQSMLEIEVRLAVARKVLEKVTTTLEEESDDDAVESDE